MGTGLQGGPIQEKPFLRKTGKYVSSLVLFLYCPPLPWQHGHHELAGWVGSTGHSLKQGSRRKSWLPNWLRLEQGWGAHRSHLAHVELCGECVTPLGANAVPGLGGS